jgi:hypothetical protein
MSGCAVFRESCSCSVRQQSRVPKGIQNLPDLPRLPYTRSDCPMGDQEYVWLQLWTLIDTELTSEAKVEEGDHQFTPLGMAGAAVIRKCGVHCHPL